MCVCMCVVNMYTLSAGYRLDAIGSRHAAKQKQMTGFFLLSPRRMLYACLFVVAQDVLLVVCAIRLGCGPVNTNRMLHIRYKCTHIQTASIALYKLFFFLPKYIYNKNRTQAALS